MASRVLVAGRRPSGGLLNLVRPGQLAVPSLARNSIVAANVATASAHVAPIAGLASLAARAARLPAARVSATATVARAMIHSTTAASRPAEKGTAATPSPFGKVPTPSSSSSVDAGAPAALTTKPDATRDVLRLQTHNAKMARAVYARKYDDVFAIYREIKFAGLSPNVFTMNTLILAFGLQGDLREAHRTYLHLMECGLEPNIATFNNLLVACAESDDPAAVRTAFRFLADMDVERGLEPNETTFANIVNLCAAHGLIKHGIEYKDSMRNKGMPVKRDTYEVLVEASLLAGETKKGFAVALEMEAEGHVLSPGQYHKLFQSALDTSFVEGAIHAFDYLCNRSPARFSLDTGTIKRAMNLGATLGKVEYVQALLEFWRDRTPLPVSPSAYSIVLAAQARLGDQRAILQTLRDMVVDGVPVTTAGLFPVVESIGRSCDFIDDAYYFLRHMHENEEVVPVLCINAIIMACARTGELDRAFATFREIPDFGCEPDVLSFNALLEGTALLRESESSQTVFEELGRTPGVVADADSYAWYALCSFRCGDLVGGHRALQDAIDAGFPLTDAVVTYAMKKAARLNDKDMFTTLRTMYREAGFVPDRRLHAFVERHGQRYPLGDVARGFTPDDAVIRPLIEAVRKSHESKKQATPGQNRRGGGRGGGVGRGKGRHRPRHRQRTSKWSARGKGRQRR